MSNHRRVCGNCNVFMLCMMNDIGVLEMAHFGPYKLWSADVWRCPECGHTVICGFGQGPVAEHYQEERFKGFIDAYGSRGELVKAYHKAQ